MIIKSKRDLKGMRLAGKLAADVLCMIEPHVRPGITTSALNNICHNYITKVQKAKPAPLNYHGFPKSICTSINDVICHGIPDDRRLVDGDIINVDITVIKDGYYGDTSMMFMVGECSKEAIKISNVAKECLYIGIKEVKPGATLGDIGAAIYEHATKNNFSVVREYCGHGIGKVFHEDPVVLHYGNRGEGLVLKEGMVFTIEPMINAGTMHTVKLKDGWTVITKDGKLSAQAEHTLVVTEDGFEVFTLRSGEKIN